MKVDVIMCKDCKYYVPQEYGVVEMPICTREKTFIFGNDAHDYCSRGEIKLPDKETVMKVLKYCLFAQDKTGCEDCPYYYQTFCTDTLLNDVGNLIGITKANKNDDYEQPEEESR